MASSAARAPSTQVRRPQTAGGVERWLEAEREQLALWLPVALAGGIALWFLLPDPTRWTAAILALVGLGSGAAALGRGGRLARMVAVGALVTALGSGLAWRRAERVAHPVLARPTVAAFAADVRRVEPLPARQMVRLTLAPLTARHLPRLIRVNLAEEDAPAGLATGAVIRLRARLMPPPRAALPGAYDFARAAWFQELGATGRGFASVTMVRAATGDTGLRDRLARHIEARLPGSAGGIAAALATGDLGAIAEEDAEAMRRSGLAHLLSVSGLHITAAVALTMVLTLRILALSRRAALRLPLPMVAAGAGAMAAVGYTLLTGAQVPTVRSCVAALLVLAALAAGREAVTLRLVAAGAGVVLLFRPEAAAGASFQLSFAAITAIVAVHEHPGVRGWFEVREEAGWRRVLRNLGSLLLTGLVVEAALVPIAAYHFHRAGLYGAAANMVAIPLTTFVVMPAEALALLAEPLGTSAPFWWVVERSLALLLWIAHRVASAPGAVAALPVMPTAAYALMLGGGLWLALWSTRVRRWGLVAVAAGGAWALTTPVPDVLVTGDGRHVAIRLPGGRLASLRERTGDYTGDLLAEAGGSVGVPLLLLEQAEARCSRDACVTEVEAGGRRWRIAATRSAYLLPRPSMEATCAAADVMVSERRLPDWCRPRWLKLDRPTLARTGGVAIDLSGGSVRTVERTDDQHPWVLAAAGPQS